MDDSNLPPPSSPQPPPVSSPRASVPTPPPPPLLTPPRLTPTPRKSRGWKIAVTVLACLLAVSLLSNFWHLAHSLFKGPTAARHGGPRLEEVVVEDNDSDNKIAVVPVEGIISSDLFDGGSYSLVDYIQDQLKIAARDARVKAVLLKVNSPGGEVLASDDIYNAIANFQKDSGKPVIASMSSVAASGGYYVSAPCRWIVANDLTITGSIGVIFHSINYRGLMDKIGLRPEVYKSGKFKDMLSGDKKEEEITSEERKMVQKLIDETFERFKTVVAEGRHQANKKNKDNKDAKGQPLQSNWADYADGRVLSGKEAHELGFVDELGDFQTAAKRARKLARIEHANLVQYQQIFNLSDLFRLFGKSDAPRVKVDVGLEGPKLKAGQLYYLCPTFVH
jgi:protease-4